MAFTALLPRAYAKRTMALSIAIFIAVSLVPRLIRFDPARQRHRPGMAGSDFHPLLQIFLCNIPLML